MIGDKIIKDLIFDILKENLLVQVIKLYDVERSISTNIEKLKLMYKEIINDSSHIRLQLK